MEKKRNNKIYIPGIRNDPSQHPYTKEASKGAAHDKNDATCPYRREEKYLNIHTFWVLKQNIETPKWKED